MSSIGEQTSEHLDYWLSRLTLFEPESEAILKARDAWKKCFCLHHDWGPCIIHTWHLSKGLPPSALQQLSPRLWQGWRLLSEVSQAWRSSSSCSSTADVREFPAAANTCLCCSRIFSSTVPKAFSYGSATASCGSRTGTGTSRKVAAGKHPSAIPLLQ